MDFDLSPAADGHALAVRRFVPTGSPWATMLIAGAMGVRQDFYAPIARFFADQGIHVLTFDYRGMGWSRRESLAKMDVDVTGWAVKDLNAMLHEARKAAPDLPLVVLGHSLGKSLRIVGDLPKGVAYQWRRWCLHPDYLISEGDEARASYARLNAPMLSYSFDDDVMITAEAVDSLNRFYTSAPITRRHLSPAEVGARRLGHFGYFAEASGAPLWRESLGWLQGKLEAAA